MIITSLQNPRIKAVIGLRDRRKREDAGLILVEGFEELSLALESGAHLAEVYYCQARFRDPARRSLINTLQKTGASLIEVDDRVFDKMSYRENPDGWLATVQDPTRDLESLDLGPAPLLVICESVEKPGNLGAILRTADAAGVNALISCDPLTDWGNPNVVRASKGALFCVPVAESRTDAAINWLRGHGIRIQVATPDATDLYTNVDLHGPVAIVVGAEKHGVSSQWTAHADARVKIPMFGRVNSLNVATATALMIYEAVRQRNE